MDAIISNQELCLNTQTGEWEHVLDVVPPYNAATMPNNSKVVRAVVGWIRDGKYVSFTYRQEAVKSAETHTDVSGQEDAKAKTVAEAFSMWQTLILSQEQVGLGLPYGLDVSDNDSTQQDVAANIDKITRGLPQTDSSWWKNNLSDPEFKTWALLGPNQLQYFSTIANKKILMADSRAIWRLHGERIALGEAPEFVVRTITVMKQP